MTPSHVPAPTWRVLARKTLGATHRRNNLENQDSCHTVMPEDHAGCAASVADGHGSVTSFRSSVGSRFAVEVSAQLAEELLQSTRSGRGADVKHLIEDRAGKQLVHEWRKKVAADIASRPFHADELARLKESSGLGAVEKINRDSALAYGSTLLSVVATDSFMVFWQIGDGDILVVNSDGNVSRPIQRDPELLGNATTSLCSPDAWRHFRSAFSGSLAPFVLISTDGLANSFADETAFFRFGSDLFNRITTEGLDSIDHQLPNWLRRISEQGSGDDIALAILCQDSMLPVSPLGLKRS